MQPPAPDVLVALDPPSAEVLRNALHEYAEAASADVTMLLSLWLDSEFLI